jgi:hypothetical protein
MNDECAKRFSLSSGERAGPSPRRSGFGRAGGVKAELLFAVRGKPSEQIKPFGHVHDIRGLELKLLAFLARQHPF